MYIQYVYIYIYIYYYESRLELSVLETKAAMWLNGIRLNIAVKYHTHPTTYQKCPKLGLDSVVCAYVRGWRVCVRACVSVRACARARACVCVCVSLRVCACVCECVCV